MALVNPFITNKFVAYLDQKRSTTVSLAVWLIDEVTGKRPEIEIAVRLQGDVNKPIKSLSGYWCFTDLTKDVYTLVAELDPGRHDRYADVQQQIELATLDALNPVVELTLKPSPSYPFPKHLTVIRGVVHETEGTAKSPLAGIPVYRLFKFKTEATDEAIAQFVTELQRGDFSDELRQLFERLLIPIEEGAPTVTTEADEQWTIEWDGERQQCIVELIEGQLDIYCRKSTTDPGIATKSDRNGEYVLYIKKFIIDQNSNQMTTFVEAESGSSRQRKTVEISAEGNSVTRQNFEFQAQ